MLPLFLIGTLVLYTTWAAIPFVLAADISWSRYSGAFLAGTVALVVATWMHAIQVGRLPATLAFTAYAFVLTWTVETIGQRHGIPFGATWRYHEALGPRLAGDVPVAIPLAWYVLAYTPVFLLRGYDVAPASRVRPGRLVAKVSLAASCLAGSDVLIDPLVISTGAWTWEVSGLWFGVPLSNYAGWFATGVLLFAPAFAADRTGASTPVLRAQAADRLMAAGSMLLLALAGVASIRRLDTAWPLVAAMAIMAPTWAVAAPSLLADARVPASDGPPRASAAGGHE